VTGRAGSRAKAVVFDLAGTLTVPAPPMDPDEPWRRYAAVAAPDNAAELVERLRAAEHCAFVACRVDGRSFTFARILEVAGARYVPEAVAAYRACWVPYTRCAGDAAAVLAALRDRGLLVGLLSNTVWPASWHREYLARDGLLELFDATLFTSELPVAKPHPEAFAAALARLGGLPAADCLFVGDRLFEDIAGAQGAGMHTVALRDQSVPTRHGVPADVEPTFRINHLVELAGVVDVWLSSEGLPG
jgi:putative hydrolase of the HAD superfamily